MSIETPDLKDEQLEEVSGGLLNPEFAYNRNMAPTTATSDIQRDVYSIYEAFPSDYSSTVNSKTVKKDK